MQTVIAAAQIVIIPGPTKKMQKYCIRGDEKNPVSPAFFLIRKRVAG